MNKYYSVQIINNQTGRIIQDEDINTGNIQNYNEVLKQYNNAKYQYKDTNATISVLRFEDDKVKTMYQKVYKQEKEEEIKENIYDICDKLNSEISDACNKIKRLRGVYNKVINAYNKKQDLNLHKWDNLPKKNKYELNNEEIDKYLDISIDMQAIRSDRRYIKNQKKLVENLINKKIITQLKQINTNIKNQKDSIINFNNKAAEQWNNGTIDLQDKYIEIPYKNFKERIKIISDLSKIHKYGHIIHDDNKKVVMAYKKCAKN